jgi:hypothetical protein
MIFLDEFDNFSKVITDKCKVFIFQNALILTNNVFITKNNNF